MKTSARLPALTLALVASLTSLPAAGEPTAHRRFHVGLGLAPVLWIPDNNPLSFRLEGEFRFYPSPPWAVLADVSYVQIGESGSNQSEDGIGLWAGFLREWPIGEAETARLFPHVRAGLAFEATSTRRASSSKLVALRGGPGIDWNVASTARLNLDLEIGAGLLSIKGGSEGDSALAELTLGLALRLLWGM